MMDVTMAAIPKWDGNELAAILGQSHLAMSFEEITETAAGIPEMMAM